MKILHFSGEGHGFMSGISEYVVVTDDDANNDDHKAPGFELESETLIDDVPGSFPIDTTLVPRD